MTEILFSLVGGLALFLFGMITLSEGLENLPDLMKSLQADKVACFGGK